MTGRTKMAAFIYRSISEWLSLMTGHEFQWLALMKGHGYSKLLYINIFHQPLVSTESINHLPYYIQIKIILSVI